MTLRKKTLLIIGGTFYALIILLFFISRDVLLDNFINLEEQDARRDIARALNALSGTVSDLDATAADRAARDDTYAFIQDMNDEYARANLSAETFTKLRLNLIMLLRSSGYAAFSRAFDLENGKEIPVPGSLLGQLSPDSPLPDHSGTGSSTAGIILLPEGPMLIASRPILTGEGEGPARGTLIMGRYLDDAEIALLAKETGLSLSIQPINSPYLTPDFQEARSSLLGGNLILVRPLSEQSVAGYARITDIYDKPVLILRVDMPRDIYQQGQATISYLIISIVVVGLVFGSVTVLLLERQVLSGLAYLSKKVSSIGLSGDLSARIATEGTDELANVASTINGMLAALQQSEAELRESEERYRRLAENATDVILTFDMTMRLTYVSPSVKQPLGYGAAEFTGRTMQEAFTPESSATILRTLEIDPVRGTTGMKDLSQSWTLELELISRDGSTVPVEVKFTFLRESSGQPFGILAIARDVTERKQAEKRLQELYRKERELRQELQEEISKRVEFTRALVHELKSPITPVVTASELLIEELKEEPALSLAQSISKGAYNLNHRIDELLDLARGEVGMLRLNPGPVDSVRLVQEIVRSVEPVAAKNKQTLQAELPESLPSAWADEDRLRQVVLNLINNALKFTPDGGKITIRAGKEGANLVIEVRDTGRGIREEDQQWIFEPYQQLDSERPRHSGLGLGLSLSKKLVELHGGQIWVKSQKGKGSTFGFSIPFKAAGRNKGTREEGEDKDDI